MRPCVFGVWRIYENVIKLQNQKCEVSRCGFPFLHDAVLTKLTH